MSSITFPYLKLSLVHFPSIMQNSVNGDSLWITDLVSKHEVDLNVCETLSESHFIE